MIASELQTAHLRLAVIGPEQAAALADYYARNHAALVPWSPPLPDAVTTPDYWRPRLDKSVEEHRAGREARFWIFEKDSDEIIGGCALNQIARGAFHACYLGYSMDTRYRRRGLMTEAVQAAVDHAFGTLRLHRIMANYLPENLASARLLAKLGFTVEGFARNYLFIRDRWRDHVMTSLTHPAMTQLPPEG